MPNDQAIADLLQQAEALLAQGEPRQAATLLDKVLRLDFTHPRAWQLLHQMLGKGEPLEQFQHDFAQANYPALAYQLEPPDLVPLTPVLIEPPMPQPAAYQPPQAPPIMGAEGKMCAYCGRYNPPGQAACLLCGAALTQLAQVQTSSPQAVAAPQPPPTSPSEGSQSTPGREGGKEGVPPPVNLICRACGTVNRPPSRFCIQCGASLEKTDPPAPAADALLCRACGTQNQPPSRFCTHCGTSLFNVDQPVPTPPQQVITPSPSGTGSAPPPPPQVVVLQAHQPPVTPPQQVVVPVPAPTPAPIPPPPPGGGGAACPNCGRQNPPGARLCAFCGYDFYYQRVVTAEKAKERPGFRFHFVDVGDLVVVISLFLPWSFADGAFYTTYLLNVWGVIARQSCGPWIIAFIVLSLGASLLVRAHHRLLAILAAIGSLISIIVVLDNIRGDEIGVQVAIAGACLVLLGVIFFENEPLNAYVRRHRKNIIIAALALPLLLVLSFVVFGLVQDSQNTARIRATSTAAAKTQTAFVAQRTAAAGTKAAATQTILAPTLVVRTQAADAAQKTAAVQAQTVTAIANITQSYLATRTKARQVTPPVVGADFKKYQLIYNKPNRGVGEIIYTANADGSNERQAVDLSYTSQDCPRFAPNRSLIAFLTYPKSYYSIREVWVANSNGSSPRRLSEGKCPVWSPDSRSLFYTTGYSIYRINSDGSNKTKLKDVTVDADSNEIYAYTLSISPDGSTLLYPSNGIVFAMDVNGGNARAITPSGTGKARTPSWSPDGSQIAFTWESSNRDNDLYVMNKDGTNWRRLTFDGYEKTKLTWSPDGVWINYSGTTNQWLVIRSDGSGGAQRIPLDGQDLYFVP